MFVFTVRDCPGCTGDLVLHADIKERIIVDGDGHSSNVPRWIVGPRTGVSLLLRLDLDSGVYDGWINLENCLVQNELARRSP